MIKYILLFITFLLNNAAFAERTIGFDIKFGSDKFSDLKIESSDVPITCKGAGNAYGYERTDLMNGGKMLEVQIKGPFDTDNRGYCHLADDTVYFVVTKLKVHFTYLGYKGQECIIEQGIGTGWDNTGRKNNKLQGDYKKTDIPCSNNSGFYYKLTPGSYDFFIYNRGDITIYKGPIHGDDNHPPIEK